MVQHQVVKNINSNIFVLCYLLLPHQLLFLQYEAIPESLKNLLLVMDSAGVFSTADGSHSPLWTLTWDRISAFLPHLQRELFKSHPPPAPPLPPQGLTLITL